MSVKMTVFELGFKVWVRYDLVENANLENQDSRSKTNKIMEMKMSVIGKKTGKQAAAWKTGFCLFVNRAVVPDSLQPTVAHQAPQSMVFSRQGYCSDLPFPSPGKEG